jgi:putative peptidoglycan lipid II flippase
MLTAVRTNISRWNLWRNRSVNSRIFSATVTVGVLGIGVKIAGWAKLVVIARRFGTGDELDAFLIAFLIPSFLAEVAGASFSSALIPTLVEVRETQGRQESRRLFSGVTLLAGLLLCVVAMAAFLARHSALALLASSFSGAKLRLTESMLVAMLPLVVLMGISAVWRATLNAGEKFALAAGVPAVTPLLTIVLVLAAGRGTGAPILAAGALAGTAIELGLVGWAVRRSGYSLVPRWTGMQGPLRQVLGQYAPMVAGAVVMSGAPLVDQAFAAALGTGAVSAFNYGTKLVVVFLAVGPVALSTVVLPHFSRMAAKRDAEGLWRTLKTYARWIVLATVPLAVVLMVSSGWIVRVLFERGAFTAADTQVVTAIQRYAALQIPFAVLGVLILRVLSSVKANHFVMWSAGISLLATILFDYEFARHWGLAGIALARGAVAAVSLCYLGAILVRVLRRL